MILNRSYFDSDESYLNFLLSCLQENSAVLVDKKDEQLKKARKKAKRFKRKYLQLREEYMKLINKSNLEPDAGEIDFDTGYTAYSKTQIDNCPAVDFDAMIEEVREIRDAWSDEADCRTVSGVNQTITDCVRILQKYKQKLQ